jgi:hypothetical protein
MKGRLIVCVVAIAAIVGVTAATGVADPDLTNVPPHRHWLGDPADGVQIGPRLCDNPNLQKAFNQFHFNVHHSFIPPAAGGPGQIDTLGPQDGAPGLHNSKGGELTFTALAPGGCGLPPGVTG